MPTSPEGASSGGLARRLARPAQVLIVSSVMFTFIYYWRTAAVVLCDLASTAYYIGGIVEQSIGPAAPWFILAVMLFSYAVRSVYIESCALFVRGGVYMVVRKALGGTLAKLSVSVLMFDYILTGPISGVAAGHYLVGLGLEVSAKLNPAGITLDTRQSWKAWGSTAVALFITGYFFLTNRKGIHISSSRALHVMIVTTVMAVVVLGWCGATLLVDGSRNAVPLAPDFATRMNYDKDRIEDPLGFLGGTGLAGVLRGPEPVAWWSVAGVVGLCIAVGHSMLAMSGAETLAQVYREVESPKLPNFKRAAFIVFVYSLLLTTGVSFLAVLLIPNDVRMAHYSGNLIGGLAMHVVGPDWARLLLNAFVVVVGVLILAGAVNTSLLGASGVLNRVAEDGVLPDWFLKPHPRYGTTHRILYLIVGLQAFTILVTHGDMILLGEAYAFGVVWTFVFKALAMVVLRFKDRRPRPYRVPLNLRVRGMEVPVGLGLIFLVLLVAAILNLLTQEAATFAGVAFSAAFLTAVILWERYHAQRRADKHEHREPFSKAMADEITPATLGLNKLYRKLVAIRSSQNLFMLEKALAETDPQTTGVVVMTAKVAPTSEAEAGQMELDAYDRQLLTAVVERAERVGKQVRPLIVPTNNPVFAVLNTARDLEAHEVIVGASNKYTADEQLDQIAFYWINLHGGDPAPLTVRIMSRDRDIALDLGGGNRIPTISERHARTVAELRAAGVGADRVLLIHDGSPECSDLFQTVLTILDPLVTLALVPLIPPGTGTHNGPGVLHQDEERARHLGRIMPIHTLNGEVGPAIVRLAHEGHYGLIVLPWPSELSTSDAAPLDERIRHVVHHAHCRVFLATTPVIPREVVDTTPG